MLTIAYITSRKEPHFEWFADSLRRECNGIFSGINIVMVDFYAEVAPINADIPFIRVPPKPTVWQGKHRLTKEDWFAASNARNTALCYAPDGYIAYVDDVSVLAPSWLKAVQEAMDGGYVALGAYQKVNKLIVENGLVKSFEEFDAGKDQRLGFVNQDVTPCGGNWLYGCSLAGPVEAFLKVNGWPEDLCDGHGFEDCCMGVVMKNSGADLRFDRRMMTYESEEAHHTDAFRRSDYHFRDGELIAGGNDGPDDKSHVCLKHASEGQFFKNHFDIRELRRRILRGEPFPIDRQPTHEWFTGLPIGEL